MSGRGVHFALDDGWVQRLRDIEDHDDRLDFLENELEELFFEQQPEWVCETDKCWDAIHRALTDGDLGWDNGSPPLNQVIIVGEQLYDDEGYILSLKSPAEVQQIAAALAQLTPAVFKAGYDRIQPEEYDGPHGLEDYQVCWDAVLELMDFYRAAAAEGRSVLFTVSV